MIDDRIETTQRRGGDRILAGSVNSRPRGILKESPRSAKAAWQPMIIYQMISTILNAALVQETKKPADSQGDTLW
jgi:hypothetical protein